MKITITQQDAFNFNELLFKIGLESASLYRLVGTYEIRKQGDSIAITPIPTMNPEGLR